MFVDMIAQLFFILQWCDCTMSFGEYSAVSVKRCVPCLHYETSGSPLPSSVTLDYMDQILKKKISTELSNAFFALLLPSNVLSLSFLS